MHFSFPWSRTAVLLAIGVCAALPLAAVWHPAQSGAANKQKAVDPWTTEQALHATDVLQALGAAKNGDAPTIVYVGFPTLFEGGHLPGATFHGTASKEEGLAELKRWIATRSEEHTSELQ